MMQGVVNANCEATIRIVVGGNSMAPRQLIDAVIDSGYTGFLTLPQDLIAALALPWTGVDRGTLGDGSEAIFRVYTATVIWDGQYRKIPINEAETDPLVGMSLLYGYEVRIQAVEGGKVYIESLV